MRIALLGAYPIKPFAEKLGVKKPPQNITSWNVNLAKGLASIPGNEVHFITINHSIPRDQIFTCDDVTLHFLSAPAKMRFPTFFQYNKIKVHKEISSVQPDIVHGHGTEHEYPYIAATSNYPAAVTIHCVLSDLLKKGRMSLGQKMRVRFMQYFEKKALLKTRSIIFTTEYMLPLYNGYLSRKKWFILDNAVDASFFTAEPTDKKEDRLLYVGRISPEKNLLMLLKAFKEAIKKAPQLKLHIAGPIADKRYYRQIRNFIANKKLEQAVHYEGPKPREKIAQLMTSCFALVLPSRYEAFGLVLAEAMAAGIPVIATKVGGVPYVAKDGKAGFLIEPDDINTLTDRILLLLNDKKLCMKLGRWSRNEARHRFSQEVIAKNTMEAYYDTLKL